MKKFLQHGKFVMLSLMVMSLNGVACEDTSSSSAAVKIATTLLSKKVLAVAVLTVVGLATGSAGLHFAGIQPGSFVVDVVNSAPVTTPAPDFAKKGGLGKSKIREKIEEGQFPGAFSFEPVADPVREACSRGYTILHDTMKEITPGYFANRTPASIARSIASRVKRYISWGAPWVKLASDPHQTYAKGGTPGSAVTPWRHGQAQFVAEVLGAVKGRGLTSCSVMAMEVDADRGILEPPHEGSKGTGIVGSDTDFLLSMAYATDPSQYVFIGRTGLYKVVNKEAALRLANSYFLSFGDPWDKNDKARLCTSLDDLVAYFKTGYLLFFFFF